MKIKRRSSRLLLPATKMNHHASITQLTPIASVEACRHIAASLPEWFGIPEANERYAQGVKERLCLGYIDNGQCLGMLCLEFPFPATANIYWMGVKKDAHGKGIGKALMQSAERLCLEKNIYSLTVETLSPKENDSNYLNTFRFYVGAGFKPLFELHTYGPDYFMVYLHKPLSPQIFTWIDLTHEISEEIPTWDKSCGFKHTDLLKYEDCSTECKFSVQRMDMLAGAGTHMDAPAHCFPTGKTIAEIPLASLIAPCVVINVSGEANEHYCVERQTIEQFENEYGTISKNTFVIVYTGWERFWGHPEKYHNNYRFPSISKQAAEYLAAKDIAGIGIDTLSPDRPESGFPVHQILLGAGKYIVENIANAAQMPIVGSHAFILPIKTMNGTEAPIRLLGCIPPNSRATMYMA